LERTPLRLVINYSSYWGDELLEAVLFLLGEGAEVNVQNEVKMNFMISFQLMTFEIEWSNSFILC